MGNLRNFIVAVVGITASSFSFAQSLYTQSGSDVPFAQLISQNILPVGFNSTLGVKGSEINVNNGVVEVGAYARLGIVQAMGIHTVGNSAISRASFPRWSRWYQEDGNTQVFRLFKGEYNVRNTRGQAARIEAHSNVSWGRGAWHEWVGRYTFVKPMNGAIFQVFNPINQWALQLGMNSNGDITLNHRRNQADQVIARGMAGKGFDLRVRDNGQDYEVYINGAKVGAGSYDRPTGNSGFRWGMYVGATDVTQDGMIFVTGATVDPRPGTVVTPPKPPSSVAKSSTPKPTSTAPRSSSPAAPRSSSSAAGGGKCTYLVGSEWNTGFTGTIRITNTTTRVINGWNVKWAYSDGTKVTSSWNVTLTGANPYSASNISWNGAIQPGQYAEFGFQANKGSSPKAQIPSVTGSACQ